MVQKVWSHPRMARRATTFGLRLMQKTQQEVVRTALEVIQFDPWPRYHEQLSLKFAGHRMPMKEKNRTVSEKRRATLRSADKGSDAIWEGGRVYVAIHDQATITNFPLSTRSLDLIHTG